MPDTVHMTFGAGTTSVTHGNKTYFADESGVLVIPWLAAEEMTRQNIGAVLPDTAPVAPQPTTTNS
jgi:hypothetical protein